MRFPKEINKPISSMLSPKKVCGHCHLLSDDKLMKCGDCQAVSYCNAKCQKDGWKLHKHHCKEIKAACMSKRLIKFQSDLLAHSVLSEMNNKSTVLNDDGVIWFVVEEDDKSYLLKLSNVPELVEHLKKINLSKDSIKYHIKSVLEGMSFIVFLEGQVIGMKDKIKLIPSC